MCIRLIVVTLSSYVRPFCYYNAEYQSAVLHDVGVFRQLHQYRRQAREVTARFKPVKAWLATAAMPPPEDADRLTRYQTTLEKQLSRYVGELLQLQPTLPPG